MAQGPGVLAVIMDDAELAAAASTGAACCMLRGDSARAAMTFSGRTRVAVADPAPVGIDSGARGTRRGSRFTRLASSRATCVMRRLGGADSGHKRSGIVATGRSGPTPGALAVLDARGLVLAWNDLICLAAPNGRMAERPPVVDAQAAPQERFHQHVDGRGVAEVGAP